MGTTIGFGVAGCAICWFWIKWEAKAAYLGNTTLLLDLFGR